MHIGPGKGKGFPNKS